MRIGLDLSTLQPQPAGMGQYLLGMVRGLSEAYHPHQIHLFWPGDSPFLPGGEKAEAAWTSDPRFVHHPVAAVRNGPGESKTGGLLGRFWFEFRHMAALANDLGLDVYHAPHYTSPPGLKARLLLGVPDLSGVVFPGEHQWFRAAFFRRMCRVSLGRAQAVCLLSESMKRDFTRVFPGFEKPLWLHPCSVSPLPLSETRSAAVMQKLALTPQGYFLFVGTLEPRKNLIRLVQAHTALYEALGESTPPLVLAGKWGWNSEPLREAMATPQAAGRVLVTGYVEETEKWALLQNALGVVYPSVYEGFGIPVAEAMAAGAPVITSEGGSTAEVAGEGALLVNPHDTGAVTQAMARLAQDTSLRQTLSQKGLAAATRFLPENTTRKLLGIYESLTMA